MQQYVPGTAAAFGSMKLLVVDDDQGVRSACEAMIRSVGIATTSAASAREALAAMERAPVDVVLTDLRMPGMNGLEFLHALRKTNPDVFVIVMSGYGSIETAVEAMQLGARHFIRKPFKLSDILQTLAQIEAEIDRNGTARNLQREMERLGGLVGKSPEMQRIYRGILRAANSSSPVLIQGENGTGKELLAKSIHLATKGCQLPFIPVDCCSIVPELLESELFGHVKGSFRGALTNKLGLLASAECGTVLLNEVADLSIEVQTKLGRALQEKAVRPYGGTKTVPIRARIIATSSRDLEKAVSVGKFRQDLYYRLSVLTMHLPPLRQRKEDIPLIIEHILRKLHDEYGIKKNISGEALQALLALDWPGNVRELETVLERAFTLAVGSSIGISALLQESKVNPSAPATEGASCKLSLAQLERISVIRAIEDAGGDKQKAARSLGISRTTLYRKLNEYEKSK